MRRKGLTEILENCAEELCKRVNLPYPPPNGTKYNVDDAQWTMDEEHDFKIWMFYYLRKHSMFKRKSLKESAKEVDMFLFNYGWKYKKENEEKDAKI